jgi:hypothetical protein
MHSAGDFSFLEFHDDASFEFFWAWGNLSMQWGAAQATPHFIASMSLRLVIPGWVALQQSPLALRQPSRSCQNRRSIKRGSIVITPFSIRFLQTKNCKGCPGTKCKGCLGTGHGFRLVGWNVGNFGNRLIAPLPPPSTPKNIDLHHSTPALILAVFGGEVHPIALRIYSFAAVIAKKRQQRAFSSPFPIWN